MFHDGGGNRSQTVAALRELIPRLRARGFHFVPLSRLAGLSASAVAPATSGFERSRGYVFELSVRVAFVLTAVFAAVLLAIGVLVACRAVLLLALATHQTRTSRLPRGNGSDPPPSGTDVRSPYT